MYREIQREAEIQDAKDRQEQAEKQWQAEQARIKSAALGVIGFKVFFALIAPFITVWAIQQFVPSVALTFWTWLAAFWVHYFINAKIEIDLSKLTK